MRYKIKRQSLQEENLMAQEEGVAYITNPNYAANKTLDKLSYEEYVDKALEESDKEAENPNTKYYEFADVIKEMREIINDFKI